MWRKGPWILILVWILSSFPGLAESQSGEVVIKLAAVGDVMMGSRGRMPPNDGKDLFTAAKPYLQGFDLVFCNHEGTLTDRGAPTKKSVSGRSYVFRTPPRYVQHLADAGFNLVSLANNHSYDYGDEGKNQTVETLESRGIGWADVGTVAIREVKGKKVALIGFYTHPQGEHYLIDIEASREWIRKYDAEYDLLIVSFHAGAEGADRIHVPRKMEYFLGSKRGDVFAFARAAVDAGADLVIGHGPHVPRAVEVYQDRLIAYSLGNFVTLGFGTGSNYGLAPLLQVQIDGEGRLLGGAVVSFVQKSGRPIALDRNNGAAGLMYKVGETDFPDTNALDAEGKIRGR